MSQSPFASLNFSTSTGDDVTAVTENRRRFFDQLGLHEEHLAAPRQVHSATIHQADEPGTFQDCDALFTLREDLWLSVLTADCIPILIWSLEKPVIAAVHSGWRGTRQKILSGLITRLQKELGIDPGSLLVFLGPGLQKDHFEVGPEFESFFEHRFLEKREGRLYFDNSGALREQALEAGIQAEHLEDLGYCTYEDQDRFYSHRRDGQTTGRMMAIIGRRG